MRISESPLRQKNPRDNVYSAQRLIQTIVTPCVTLLCLFTVQGCGGSSSGPVNMGGEDGQKIAIIVEDFNDVRSDPKKLSELFTKTQTPADAKKFGQFTLYVKGRPKVSGASAVCNVQIERADGTPVGEREWTFAKVDDTWKIETAQLP